jgi:prepilin-type N-terminal cleavage/methylation domain-containing protein/prepilin-type processing-associated H-X9-DG protein
MQKTIVVHTKNRGFTLIELLVVIAIISILAAILFPVFARARENARRASCMSNLKQIGLGLMMYTQDYDERYPFVWRPITETTLPYNKYPSDYFTWADATYPYTKSIQLLQCPSYPVYQYGSGITPYMASYKSTATSYMINQHSSAGLADSTDGGLSKISMAAIGSPSTTIEAYDLFGKMDTGGWTIDGSQAAGADLVNLLNGTIPAADTGYYQYINPTRRHLDGTNILWCDGHVKWQKTVTEAEFTLTGND